MGTLRSEGDRLGPFELVGRLGMGGMGEVWEAVLHGPAGFRKPVALKCLRPDLLSDPETVQLLLREARLGALLQHPNVVGTFGLSRHDGAWVVALELVRGASTSELLRDGQGPLPARAVLDVGIQAAAGLAHAHTSGLVHRDVKPSNLLVDRTGFVKLADLGISLLAGEAVPSAGTPGYMAPEQLEGRVDWRSDLFSLGVTLYVLATGTRPLGRGARALVALRDVEAMLLSEGFFAPVDVAVPGLGEVLRRCLRSEPEARWGSAQDLGEALGSLRVRQADGDSLLALLAAARPGLGVASASVSGTELTTRILPSGNLVPARNQFVGRSDELAHLDALVRDDTHRLVVLLGPGGMGKTRLAVEVARSQRTLPGGAWLWDLTDARSVEGICSAVAAVLAVDLESGDPVAQLGRVLSAKGRCLVVLDNLEQCVAHLPSTLGRWLDMAPQATFIGTSRVVLQLFGEHAVPLGPLATADAVALFLERASRPVRPDEQGDVESLCTSLQGMPLAIELAAARVGLLGVERIRSRVSLALLSGGHRERPARHRSLQASLDWSVELLSEPGRAALGALSVFEGGWTLEAAEAVLEGALPLLEELVQASLLRVDPKSSRFSMLEVVREYASALAGEALETAEARHGAHFAQLGTTEAIEALSRPGGGPRRRALRLELDNLVVACRRAVRRGDHLVAIATLRACWAVLRLHGPFPVAVALAEAVVGMPDSTGSDPISAAHVLASSLRATGRVPDAIGHLEQALEALDSSAGLPRATLLGDLAQLYLYVGRTEDARATAESALERHRAAGNRRGEASVMEVLGTLHQQQGRIGDAREHFSVALDVYQELVDRRAEGTALGRLGGLHRETGRMDEARAHYEASLAVHRELSNRASEANVLGSLGTVFGEQGQMEQARAHFEASLAGLREVGDRRRQGVVLGNLGAIDYDAGDFVLARQRYEEALRLHQEVGNRRSEGIALGNLGNLYLQLGQADRAQAVYEQALVLQRALGNRRSEGVMLVHLGGLHLEQGTLDRARSCYVEGLTLNREVGNRRFEGHTHCRLARVSVLEGDLEAADRHLEQGDVLLREVGAAALLAELLALKAEVAWMLGDPRRARLALAEAVGLAPPDHADAQAALVAACLVLES